VPESQLGSCRSGWAGGHRYWEEESSRHHCEGMAEIAELDGEDYHSDPCQS
jgi:hypothetical protein